MQLHGGAKQILYIPSQVGENRYMLFELICDILLLLFFVFCYFSIDTSVGASQKGELPSSAWPQSLLLILIVCMIISIIIHIRKHRGEFKTSSIGIKNLRNVFPLSTALVAIMCLLYPVGLKYIGFLFSTPIFMFVVMSLMGEKRLGLRIIMSLLVTIVLYVLFDILLQVPLARGLGVFRKIVLAIEALL